MNYEEEKKTLGEWFKQNHHENDKAHREAWSRGEIRGLDSEFGLKTKQINTEYNRRLVLLKAKYGKELSAGEKEIYESVKDQPSRYDDSKGWEREPLPLNNP
jgi:hypothetical protein